MNYITTDINVITHHLKKLDENSAPLWGSMSVQRMIEHLTDSINLATSDHSFKLTVPEDKIDKVQGFLASEHPLPREFKVEFANPKIPIRNHNIVEAINELEEAWGKFKSYFDANPDIKTLHPSFGHLGYDQWLRLHSKQITHHLQQFGIDV